MTHENETLDGGEVNLRNIAGVSWLLVARLSLSP
jgi:hypothetical protein